MITSYIKEHYEEYLTFIADEEFGDKNLVNYDSETLPTKKKRIFNEIDRKLNKMEYGLVIWKLIKQGFYLMLI